MNWIKKLPTEEGYYWFYGQEYIGAKFKLEFVEVKKGGGDSLFYVVGGRFFFKSELGENWAFSKVELPELPKFE